MSLRFLSSTWYTRPDVSAIQQTACTIAKQTVSSDNQNDYRTVCSRDFLEYYPYLCVLLDYNGGFR